MAATYEPIATTTLGSAQSSVTFGSGGTIPQTYTDLICVMSIKNGSGTNYNTYVRFNDVTSSDYSVTYLYGTGSSAGSGRDTSTSNGIRVGYSNAGDFSTNIFHIFNYTNSTTYKTTLARANDNASIVVANVGLWRRTDYINRFTLVNEAGANFSAGSTFNLYGIKAA